MRNIISRPRVELAVRTAVHRQSSIPKLETLTKVVLNAWYMLSYDKQMLKIVPTQNTKSY